MIMRKKSKRRFQGALQNVVILCLILSAGLLLLRTGLVRTDALNSMISTVSYPGSPQQDGTINTLQPIHIAVRSSGMCSGWLNETTGGEVFEDFAPLLSEALGSASNAAAVDAAEFRRALENDSIYYDFTASLPLPLIRQWLGSSGSSPRYSARSLLLSSLQDATAALYAWDPEQNAYYRWDTTVPSDSLLNTAERHSGSALEFAFLQEAPYHTLTPYTLMAQDRVSLYDLSAKTAAAEDANALLTALEFNVHSHSRYPESNGTEVVVQGMRTLRFVPDGTVLYSGGDDGVSLLSVEHRGEEATLTECTDAAWRAASTLLRDQTGAATLYLSSASSDESGSATLQFGYLVNGYPVVFPEDYAVQIQIENNVITAFTLHLRSYTVSDQSRTLLPSLQAVAAARDSDTSRELFCGYYDDGSDTLAPGWLRR